MQKPQENNITASGIILSPLRHKCEWIWKENNKRKDAKKKTNAAEGGGVKCVINAGSHFICSYWENTDWSGEILKGHLYLRVCFLLHF